VQLSLSTACLYHLPLSATFRLAAEVGFTGVELVMGPEAWLRGPRAVARLARAHGIEIYTVHQSLMGWSPRGAGAGRIEDAARFGRALGCPCVVFHDPMALRWAEPSAQRWLRTMLACREMLDEGGTRLALENPGMYFPRDQHSVLSRLPVLLDLARRYDLDVTFDTCHAGTAGLDLSASYDLVRERLANIHLCDLKPGDTPAPIHALRTLFLHHQMPGEGYLLLADFLKRVAADGYAGPVTMEISIAALRGWSPKELHARLRQAVEFARQATA